jgi:hypothetical protein
MPPFSKYREWLASDEYKESIRKLVGTEPQPPRQDWPLDMRDKLVMHLELGNQMLHAAVNHFKAHDDILEQLNPALVG